MAAVNSTPRGRQRNSLLVAAASTVLKPIAHILVKVDVRKIFVDVNFRKQTLNDHMIDRVKDEILEGGYGTHSRYLSVALSDDNINSELSVSDVDDMWDSLEERSASSGFLPKFPDQRDFKNHGVESIDLVVLDGRQRLPFCVEGTKNEGYPWFVVKLCKKESNSAILSGSERLLFSM